MKIKEAQRVFEQMFEKVVKGEETRLNPNGIPYIAVCSGGVKEEGEPHPVKCLTEEIGAELWLVAAIRVANARCRKGILYWREEPVWDEYPFDPPYGSVYSRLVTE